jgi:glycerophosphoryl diester phosphodiesterase
MELINHLVAHRGDHYQAPENSLLAIQKALNSGALLFELDVQLTKDKVAIMLHDTNLVRTAGIKLDVFQTAAKTLYSQSIHEPDKFAKRYYPEYLASLKQVIDLFNSQNNNSKLKVFIEVKIESIENFGMSAVLKAINNELIDAKFIAIIISYDYEFIQLAQQELLQVGWVNDDLNNQVLAMVKALKPDYMFCKAQALLDYAIKPEIWQWVGYTSNNLQQILTLLRHGVNLVETNQFTRLIKKPTSE